MCGSIQVVYLEHIVLSMISEYKPFQLNGCKFEEMKFIGKWLFLTTNKLRREHRKKKQMQCQSPPIIS